MGALAWFASGVVSVSLMLFSLDFAVAAGACDSDKAADILKALDAERNVRMPDIVPTTKMFPAGATVDVFLREDYNPDVRYQAITEGSNPELLRSGTQTRARMIPPDHPKKKDFGEKNTLITVAIPSSLGEKNWTWSEGTIRIFGCKAEKVEFARSLTLPVSNRALSNLVVWPALLFFYAAAAVAASVVGKKYSILRSFDPVVLTAGSNGKGSLSKLQILFFSLIVVGLVAYIVARTGILSDLSLTILTLLGIAGAGAAASKATDVNRNRIKFENWAWFVDVGWFKEGGVADINDASWRDILTSDDEFDVYHFQSLILTVVVGGALLTTGFTDLSTFTIPEALLGVLGLSQVVYVAGKLVSPPACSDLDKATGELIAFEKDFVESAAKTPDPSEPDEKKRRLPPENLGAAIRRAGGDKYAAYISKAKDVQTMFKSVMKPRDPLPPFEAKFRAGIKPERELPQSVVAGRSVPSSPPRSPP